MATTKRKTTRRRATRHKQPKVRQLKKFKFQKGATTNKKKATGKRPPRSKVTVTVNGRTVHKEG